MKKKHYKKAKLKRYSKENQPEFLVKVTKLTFKDLKKMNLIDSKTYRESIKKKINIDYQGGNTNE